MIAIAMAASNGSEYFDIESGHDTFSFSRRSNAADDVEQEALLWAAIERLPSKQGDKFALLKRSTTGSNSRTERLETVDVTKLNRRNRSLIVKKALATSEQDNSILLAAIKERFDRYITFYIQCYLMLIRFIASEVV